jgi:hypothetical protein
MGWTDKRPQLVQELSQPGAVREAIPDELFKPEVWELGKAQVVLPETAAGQSDQVQTKSARCTAPVYSSPNVFHISNRSRKAILFHEWPHHWGGKKALGGLAHGAGNFEHLPASFQFDSDDWVWEEQLPSLCGASTYRV